MLAAVILAVMASAPLELAPGTRYDPRIPTLQSVVGHDVGAEPGFSVVTVTRDQTFVRRCRFRLDE